MLTYGGNEKVMEKCRLPAGSPSPSKHVTAAKKSMKKVLFVCVENACRSQMAQGFCAALADDVVAESAGTHPAGAVDETAVRVMAEAGVDISGQRPSGLREDMNDRFDVIVTMGCIDSCPLTPGEKTRAWDIGDPRGASIEVYRTVRDDIRRHVQQLLEEMG